MSDDKIMFGDMIDQVNMPWFYGHCVSEITEDKSLAYQNSEL